MHRGQALSGVETADHRLSTDDSRTISMLTGELLGVASIVPAVANDEFAELAVTTGTKPVDFSLEVAATGVTYISAYEGASVSGGTESVVSNRDRESSGSTGETRVWVGPSVQVTGTSIQSPVFGPVHSPRVLRRKLASNTTYLFRVQNKSGLSADIGFLVDWKEIVT